MPGCGLRKNYFICCNDYKLAIDCLDNDGVAEAFL